MSHISFQKTFRLGGALDINRVGFGAMRITGPNIWGMPENPQNSIDVIRKAVELGVNFIDTADMYGPFTSEQLIAEALHPYKENMVVATKGGLGGSVPGQTLPTMPRPNICMTRLTAVYNA